MCLEFSFLIAVVLSFSVVSVFLLECENERLLTLSKDAYLEKSTCEVCASTYFVSVFSRFWRCPFCKALNKKT